MTERRLKILHVLPKLDTGGAERVVVEICEAITRAGHRALIAAETGKLAQAALRAGAEIFEMPLAAKTPFAMRRNAGRLEKFIRDEGIALVHAHSRAPAWAAFWATQRTKTPFVTTYHGAYNEGLPMKRRYNAVMAAGDRVIAVSRFIGELVRARHHVGDDRLRIIPGGVDPHKFDPAMVQGDRIGRLARAWRLDMSAPMVMLPGRLTAWKGQKLLIAALAGLRHTDAVAVLAGAAQGRAEYVKSLIRYAELLGVADRLRIVEHDEDMPAAMMLADAVVNCSTDPEAFGRTIVEAQAMGRIVIAADHGGARETIADRQTGFLVPPGDVPALTAAIDEALGFSPEARIALGQHVRAVVCETYSVAAMQEAVLGVYAELLV